LRRVLMSQYGFLSCLVALAVDQPPTPISEEIKGVTLDLTPAWQCRMIPSQSRGTRFSFTTVTAIGPPITTQRHDRPLALRYAIRFAIRTAVFERAAQRGSGGHPCAIRRARRKPSLSRNLCDVLNV
jgi:hypothetical protein